jgi:hypothetical protein
MQDGCPVFVRQNAMSQYDTPFSVHGSGRGQSAGKIFRMFLDSHLDDYYHLKHRITEQRES